MMHKKDYEAIAALVRYNFADLPTRRKNFASGLANYLAQDNPAFDRARFMRAVEPDKKEESK